MQNRILFDENELEYTEYHINVTMDPARPMNAPDYHTPITPKENLKRVFRRDGSALWMPTTSDTLMVESRTNIDHIARAEIRDLGPLQKLEEKGGPDLFGIQWVFVPEVGGSMVKPGSPVLEDANDWEEVITFPDVDALDWEGCKINAPLNASKRLLGVTFQNGLFERLISFMDFENAAMAMIDEDQQDAVKRLFDKLADMYNRMIDKYLEILDLDIVCLHDDWGSQRAPFFSLDTCMEMVAPYLKKVADHCHEKGLLFHQHSCGKNEPLVPAMVYAGVDMWLPQTMNDVDMLVDKYGDKIIFGVTPDISPEASIEEQEQAAKALVEKYGPEFMEKPVIFFLRMAPKVFAETLYKESRLYLLNS